MKKILISASRSGMGKTVVTGGLIRCFIKLGYSVAPFKCGPDYIDPVFHAMAAGRPCRNLDTFLQGKAGMLRTFDEQHSDIKIIEGVMGLYDGLGGGTESSSFEAACLTGSSVVIVMPCGMTEDPVSELSELLSGGSGTELIKGIIFTGCSEEECEALRSPVENSTGIKVYGFLPKTNEAEFESRHLGLVGAKEIKDIRERFDSIAELLFKHVDIERLLGDAADIPAATKPCRSAGESADDGTVVKQDGKIRCSIAVARDAAFSFYYEDNLDALRNAGARLVFFSPMEDEMPEADGLYIGGGYPELHLEELSGNTKCLKKIRQSIDSGMPLVAECGGFLYMQRLLRDGKGQEYPMAGVFGGEGIFSESLNRRFGYIRVSTDRDSLLFRTGEEIPAHEFHYLDCTENGNALRAAKADGRSWECGFVSDRIYAGFPHFYFGGEHGLAERFVRKAEEYKAEREAEKRWMSLAKPLGSLGVLENDITEIACLTGNADVRLEKRSLIVFIGDHGVVEEGVSQSDHSVTLAVAEALGRGLSTVNYPARIAECDVLPVDVGMTDDTPYGVINKKTARGTRNITKGAAMTDDECRRAMSAGREMVRQLSEKGADIILLGEMGIGNTTASSAIAGVLLDRDARETVGRGAGLSDMGLERKTDAVRRAISVNQPDKDEPLDVLAKLGGFEIAALCGACLEGYKCRIPVILDGVITNTAALVACRMEPGVKNALIASHRSTEPAADMILKELKLDTLISAGVRLGEGAGALMALTLIDQALAVYNSGHTFEKLGIEPYVPL